MNKWDELTMKDRAALIKVGVANGFRNIDDIRDLYNSFYSELLNYDYDMARLADEILDKNKGNLFYEGGEITDLILSKTGWSDDTMKAVETGASFLPIVGTMMDIYEFAKEPTLSNLGQAAISLGSDVLGIGLLKGAVKGIKAAKKALKVANAILNSKGMAPSTKKLMQKAADKTTRVAQANTSAAMVGTPLFGADIYNNIELHFASGGYLDILPKPLSYSKRPAVRYNNGGDIKRL